MPKFQKKFVKPLEAAIARPEEVMVPSAPEAPVFIPEEAPVQNICGINGCTTWYEDPKIMQRHRERQHGIGGDNMNKPLPRHSDIKLA